MKRLFNESEIDSIWTLVKDVGDEHFGAVAMLIFSLPPNLREQIQDSLLSRVDKSEIDEVTFNL